MAKEKTIPAASLSMLESAPDFDLPVTIDVRGKQHKITFHCKTYSKLEWAEIRDAGLDDMVARKKERTQKGERERMVDTVRDVMSSDASLVLQFATSWDLSDALNADTLTKLENLSGGSLAAIVNAYDIAIYQGRLGN